MSNNLKLQVVPYYIHLKKENIKFNEKWERGKKQSRSNFTVTGNVCLKIFLNAGRNGEGESEHSLKPQVLTCTVVGSLNESTTGCALTIQLFTSLGQADHFREGVQVQVGDKARPCKKEGRKGKKGRRVRGEKKHKLKLLGMRYIHLMGYQSHKMYIVNEMNKIQNYIWYNMNHVKL